MIDYRLENGNWEDKYLWGKWFNYWFELRIRKGWTRTEKKKPDEKKINMPASCYVCKHFEDRRVYWCNKMNKEISGVAISIPDECPLKKEEL